MFQRCVVSSRGRLAAFAAGLALAASALLAAPAEARGRHHARHSAGPAFAAIVVDANSGRVLYGRNENELRHPASITKVMTLYLLFEQIEKGRFRLDSEIPISAHAHRQAPSKLGLDIGETIAVEDAIKAVVTKSANDIAVAIAEAVGGSEENFAALMTRKAHQLGMDKTVYVNASGLPDADQVTTARDLAILGRAIQERFPKFYGYFSTHVFNYAGASHRNHNKLLGRVEGMDGIKTGYTRDSGFNLLTSVKRDGHRLVSVVLGGTSGGSRDRIMAGLIEEHIDSGSTTRTAALIGEGAAEREVASAEPARPAPERVRVEEPARPAPRPAPPAAAGAPLQLAAVIPQIERIRPAVVSGAPRAEAAPLPSADPRKRVVLDGSTSARVAIAPGKPAVAAAVTPSALGWAAGPAGRPAAAANHAIESAAAVSPLPVARPAAIKAAIAAKPEPPRAEAAPQPQADPRRRVVLDGSTSARVAIAPGKPPVAAAVTPSALGWAAGPAGRPAAPAAPANHAIESAAAVSPLPVARPRIGKPAAKPEPARGNTTVVARGDAPAQQATAGWIIQIGATDDAGKASDLLARAKLQGKAALASARPFTERILKGDAVLYRARFAGLEPDAAEAACRSLKKSGFACFAMKN